MSNDRIRIYDLAKELNRGNKELLALCDRLNISVKSASSSISESDADHLRAVAKRHAISEPPHLDARAANANIKNTNIQEDTVIPSKLSSSTKPQVVGIQKSKSATIAPPVERATQPLVPVQTEVVKKPVRPSQTVVSFEQPELPSPPNHQSIEPQPVPELQHPKAMQPELVQPEPVRSVESSDIHHPETDITPAQPRPARAKRAKAVEAKAVLELVKPPARPAAPVTAIAQPQQDEQITLKRDRAKPVKARPAIAQAADVVAVSPSVAVDSLDQTNSQAPQRSTALQAQPAPKLRRPNAVKPVELEAPVSLLPKPILAKEKAQAVEAEPTNLRNKLEALLEQPILSNTARPRKNRQDDNVEDEQEAKAKAGKVGAKVKRSKAFVDNDDDESWDDANGDRPILIPVSAAFARPAKQSAFADRPLVAVAAAVVKGKKRNTKSDAQRHSRGDRGDRLALEAERTRPDRLAVTGSMTVQELAQALAVQDTEIVRILFFKGMAVSVTQSLDIPTITLVGAELGVSVETIEPEAEARKVTEMLNVEDLENLHRRPPVVTIMGHVDHGKTSLLDAIRHTKVAQGEAGGITQHIGAYHVDVEHEGQTQQVVFLDTPGHAAFTAMRARGARVTDIAVLVVAADDGVRPQTIEAISHAKAAGVPIIVAINKVDKPEAQPDRVKQELTEYGLVPEEWGGDTIMVSVSAIQRENLDTLLEMILLLAEVADLQANPDRSAKGTVIEANLDKTRGAVATLLVQNGTLRVGDVLVAGSAFGKVRAMVDDTGHRVDVATPSYAVAVLGLSDVPAAGDEFEVFANDKEARAIAAARAAQQRQSRLMQGRISLATLSAQAQQGELKDLNLLLKADVQGSVEAIVGALKQLPQNEVQLRLLLAAPGEITETDIDLAAASNAVIIGFNTTLASGARDAAETAGVDVRDYTIIYKLLEDIQGTMEGLLEPELVETALGQAEVRVVFPVGRGQIAGCYVQSGKVVRNCKVRVHRGSQIVYEGNLDSLKRMKDDAKEVNAGYECGIGIDRFNDWAEGDLIEAFQMVTKRRTLSAAN